MTTLTHGAEQTAKAKAAADALFGGGSLADLDGETLESALQETPHAEVPMSDELPLYVDLLVATQLAPSKGAARRTVQEGGAYVNNVRIRDVDQRMSRYDALGDGWFVLRRGKKHLAGIRLV